MKYSRQRLRTMAKIVLATPVNDSRRTMLMLHIMLATGLNHPQIERRIEELAK